MCDFVFFCLCVCISSPLQVLPASSLSNNLLLRIPHRQPPGPPELQACTCHCNIITCLGHRGRRATTRHSRYRALPCPRQHEPAENAEHGRVCQRWTWQCTAKQLRRPKWRNFAFHPAGNTAAASWSGLAGASSGTGKSALDQANVCCGF